MTDYEKMLAEEYGVYLIRAPHRPGIKLEPYVREPKRPVSPYAKFDKFHHKKKRR